MRKRRVERAGVVLAAMLLAAPLAAGALPPLSENRHINDRLFAAAVGDEIRNNCPGISARMMTVLAEARALERHALGLGYTEAQIRAYLRDREARRAMRARRDAWLEANGAVPGDADSYCRIGLREIEARSFIGSLLRAH